MSIPAPIPSRQEPYKPKAMTASTILVIIGCSIIGIAFLLGMVGSMSYISMGMYDESRTAYGMIHIATSVFWLGLGLNSLGILLALKRR